MTPEEKRQGIIGGLVLLGIGAAILTVHALSLGKYEVCAASLSVIVSIIASASAYDVIFEAKLARRPVLNVLFDSNERYMIWQLFVKNIGGGTAYNVRLEWLETSENGELRTIKPRDRDGDIVCFSKVPGHDLIASLPQGEIFSIWIDEYFSFLDNNKPSSFLARVTFQEQFNSRQTTEALFPISLEGHGRVLTYGKEIRRTEFELQKLPESLGKIASELEKLRREIQGKSNKNQPS